MSVRDEEFEFEIAVEDFDKSLLPLTARKPGTDAFNAAVAKVIQKDYESFGGFVQIVVRDKTIKVHWRSDSSKPDPLDVAIQKFGAGDYTTGIRLLEMLRRQQPNNTDVLYNLGMALSDVGRLPEALTHLERVVELSPHHTNAHVAIGVALARQQKYGDAVAVLEKAVALEPDNPWANRNLGGCLLKVGKIAEAEHALRKAVNLSPNDQQAVFGLAEAFRANDQDGEADKCYIRVIELDTNSPIAELARTARSQLSQKSFRKAGVGDVRPDAVMYLLGAMQQFAKMKPAEVQRVGFEIAVMGQKGLNPNDSSRKYTLRSLPGEFTALHLLCLMFVAFKIIAPGESIGFELSKEYELAAAMYKPENAADE